jgi:ABC-type microcin C transport system duplicated ATPase subunit YejF
MSIDDLTSGDTNKLIGVGGSGMSFCMCVVLLLLLLTSGGDSSGPTRFRRR